MVEHSAPERQVGQAAQTGHWVVHWEQVEQSAA